MIVFTEFIYIFNIAESKITIGSVRQRSEIIVFNDGADNGFGL
jgi:hypothetical protein